jgi:hypothetical protein
MFIISNTSFENGDGNEEEGEVKKRERPVPVRKMNANHLFIKLTTAAANASTGNQPVSGQSDFRFRLKMGTCEHCVLEQDTVPFGVGGKPERAWLPNPNDPDAELDFDRDALLAGLAALGVLVEVATGGQYICP